MPVQALTGTRLRERRLALGLRQADLAQTAGISASYLNLIEHNRRRIAPELLARLAKALGVAPAQLEQGAASGVTEALRTAAADFAASGAEVEQIEEFAGRFPGWSGLLAALHGRGQGLLRAVEVLNDRIAHDPAFSAALHDMLSAVASVRSTAAILAETPDLEPEWQRKFLSNLNMDSERLALQARGLVAFLDRTDDPEASAIVAPQEEVEAWLGTRGWNLGAVERPEVRAALAEEIGAIGSQSARALAGDLIERAAAETQALPEAAFAAELAAHGPDPARLARRFGTALLPVFRRIAMMPGAEAGLVLCDGSGAVTLQKLIPDFSLPRFGAVCPLWPVFAALSRPMSAVEAVVETPSGKRFRALAYAETRHPEGFSGPQVREAAMLVLPLAAGQGAALPVIRVGPTCRICPRAGCAARREASVIGGDAGLDG